MMPSLPTLILIVAIAVVGWHCWALRQQVRRGGVIVVPMATFTWVAMLVIVGVLLVGLSPVHLLWLLPLSAFLSVGLVMIPWVLHLTLNFLALLAGPTPEPPPRAQHRRRSTRSRPVNKR